MDRLLLKDGEWIKPVREGFSFSCCDCGLSHDMDFKIVGGSVHFRATRDNRTTDTIRENKNPPYGVINWVIENLAK